MSSSHLFQLLIGWSVSSLDSVALCRSLWVWSTVEPPTSSGLQIVGNKSNHLCHQTEAQWTVRRRRRRTDEDTSPTHPRLMLRTMIRFSLKTVAFLVFYFLNLNLRKNKFWLWLSESLTVVSTWCLYWLCVFLTYSSNSCFSLCSEELYNKIVLNHWAEPPEVSVMQQQQQWQRQQ